jgi:hypothetical protein
LKPLSLWHFDFDIGFEIDISGILMANQYVSQTQTDAVLYLTIYPKMGFQFVQYKSIKDLAFALNEIVRSGRRVLLRYAPDMNGNISLK